MALYTRDAYVGDIYLSLTKHYQNVYDFAKYRCNDVEKKIIDLENKKLGYNYSFVTYNNKIMDDMKEVVFKKIEEKKDAINNLQNELIDKVNDLSEQQIVLTISEYKKDDNIFSKEDLSSIENKLESNIYDMVSNYHKDTKSGVDGFNISKQSDQLADEIKEYEREQINELIKNSKEEIRRQYEYLEEKILEHKREKDTDIKTEQTILENKEQELVNNETKTDINRTNVNSLNINNPTLANLAVFLKGYNNISITNDENGYIIAKDVQGQEIIFEQILDENMIVIKNPSTEQKIVVKFSGEEKDSFVISSDGKSSIAYDNGLKSITITTEEKRYNLNINEIEDITMIEDYQKLVASGIDIETIFNYAKTQEMQNENDAEREGR